MPDAHDNHVELEQAYELTASRLPADAAERLRRHAAGCPRCAAILREAEAVSRAMAPEKAEPANKLRVERIVAAVRARRRRRPVWPVVAAAVAAAAAIALTVWLWGRGGPQSPQNPSPQTPIVEHPVEPPANPVDHAPGEHLAAVVDEVRTSDAARGAGAVIEHVKTDLAEGGRAVSEFLQTVMADVDFTTLLMDESQVPQTRTTTEGEGL